MSDTILEFAQPLLRADLTEEEIRGVIGLAVVAWNASHMPDDMWTRSVANCAESSRLSQGESGLLEDLMFPLVELKRLLFADDERFVVNFELSFERDKPHLQVAWTWVDERAESESDQWMLDETRSEQLELELDFA